MFGTDTAARVSFQLWKKQVVSLALSIEHSLVAQRVHCYRVVRPVFKPRSPQSVQVFDKENLGKLAWGSNVSVAGVQRAPRKSIITLVTKGLWQSLIVYAACVTHISVRRYKHHVWDTAPSFVVVRWTHYMKKNTHIRKHTCLACPIASASSLNADAIPSQDSTFCKASKVATSLPYGRICNVVVGSSCA